MLLFDLIETLDSKFILLSYNNEGFIEKEEIVNFLQSLGKVTQYEMQYNAFKGSRNLHKRSIYVSEYLFLVEKG